MFKDGEKMEKRRLPVIFCEYIAKLYILSAYFENGQKIFTVQKSNVFSEMSHKALYFRLRHKIISNRRRG